ncbi:cardiolipin synthase 2 [Salmonella enterica subsp. enterica serovar Heidelberg str. 77-1831]|nr:cardiolipin synthase 2 [Salmonella enterica subsp. enterica serovar Heidelberg str. N1514]KJT96340.1 cardiolipin synthase 2 [Salmonella enterica subsp. enterica serovar Heidelberg str. 77-1831]
MKCGWREGNQIQLLENGDQFYPAVFEAIAQAQQKSFWKPLSYLKMRWVKNSMPLC